MWARALALVAAAGPVAAQDAGLMGRQVQFTVITGDTLDDPFFASRAYVSTVVPGPEFGLVQEGTPGIDVVPVTIDVSRDRIRFSYAGIAPGAFLEAGFNGYVLTFVTDCVLIEGASVIAKGTTLPLTDKDLIVFPQRLALNVAGLDYTPEDTIHLAIDVGDCPLS